MLLEYSKCIAYICPYCGRLTERGISLFDIPPGGAVFLCSEQTCVAKVLTISTRKDKYIAEPVCTACGEKHKFTLRRKSFWQKKKLVLSCPETSVDILFFGDKDEVDEELKKQDMLYREAEAAICEDPGIQLYFDIIREVNRIAKEDKVVCGGCGSKATDIELIDEGVHLVCRDCGADRIIEVSSKAYMNLLNEGTIVLE